MAVSGQYDGIAAIGSEAMTLGFRLAGVRDFAVVEEEEAARFEPELLKMLDKGGYSIIIANQRLLAGVSQKTAKRIQDSMTPIVVGVPDKGGVGIRDESLKVMIKKSLGVELRLHE